MEIQYIIDIVKEASKCMDTTSFEVSLKNGFSDIVTTSDLAVQEFLCSRLATLLPNSGFLCEEKDIRDTEHEYTWIIDPIDGTANYSRHIDQCAICVGLKHNAKMEKAVVYLPRTEEMFWAEKGQGAYRNGQKIHVSDRPFDNAILCTALAVYHKEYAKVCGDIILETFLQCNDIRRFGAAAPELCYIAMGRCELYFEYLLGPWDFAAASLILSEAGGYLSNLEGKELSTSCHSGVLVGNTPENLKKLQEIVRRNMELPSSI